MHAEDLRWLAGEAAHGFAHRHRPEIARPVAHQVQAKAGVVEERQMRTGIAQADDAVRMVEHAADGFFVCVEQLRREDGLQLLGDRQVEHHIERVAELAAGDVGDALLFMVRVRWVCGFDHLHLVPLAVEEAEVGRRCQFSAHPVAKALSGKHGHQRIAVQAERGLPALESLDRIRGLQREVHRQRAARHLADEHMAARVGGRDRVEVVEHRVAVGAVVQQRGHHHRAAAVGGQGLEKWHRGVTPFRQHENAVAALAHGRDQRAHFAVIGQPRRHRPSALAVVRGRRAAGKADRASLHRFAHDCLHLCDLDCRGGALGRIVSHHIGAHAAVADVGGDVDRTALAPKLRQVLGKGLELPRDAPAQHVQRHALDLGQVAHRDVAVLRLARRDGEAAIADHRRRHAQRRRGPHTRIPGDLGVEVGVAVDDARHQAQAVGLDHLACRCAQVGPDLSDAAISDGDILDRRRAAGAVEDQGVAEK